jgi:tetratricopeptide (TPR) repeat protein
MKYKPFSCLGSAAVPLFLALATGSLWAGDDDLQAEINAIWRDPTFQKRFIGSYGIDAEVEPRVTPEEVKVLEKIRPLMADNLPKAEALLRKEMDEESSATLDFTLGGLCFQQDKLPEAEKSFQEAVDKFPSFRRAWRNLGLIHVRNGKHDQAIGAFTRMIELGGGDAYSYGLLGLAYASKGDYQAAEAGYRNALLLQPENAEWRLGLTRCVFKQDKFQDAAALLDVLIERNPENADFWLLQAHSFLSMKQPLRAAENLEVLDLLGGSTLDSLNTLGDVYVTEGLMDFAVRAYQRALELDPLQPADRPLQSAELLASRGGPGQARQLSARIREVLGESIGADQRRRLLKLDARLSMAQGESSPETVALLEEIIAIEPLDGDALMLLGQHYAEKGEPERAIFYFERAASLASFEANANIRHAQVLVNLGRHTDAIPLLRRAQEIAHREDVARYLEQVERIARARR